MASILFVVHTRMYSINSFKRFFRWLWWIGLIVESPGRQRVRGVAEDTDEDPKSEKGKGSKQLALEVSHASCRGDVIK